MAGLDRGDMPETTVGFFPTSRMHPPYCEARGPTVQEGFVAARVQAFQILQAQGSARRGTSHSPMIPCPGGETSRSKARYKAPYARNISRINVDFDKSQSSGSGTSCNSEIQLSSNPQPASASVSADVISDKNSDGAVKTSNERAPNQEKEILSPHAVMPQMADPFTAWASLRHNQETKSGMALFSQPHQQQRSVADTLSAKVELGWAVPSEEDESSSRLNGLGSLGIRGYESAVEHASLPIPDAKPLNLVKGSLSLPVRKARTPETSKSPTTNFSQSRNAESNSSSKRFRPIRAMSYDDGRSQEPPIRNRAIAPLSPADSETSGSKVSEQRKARTFNSFQRMDQIRNALLTARTSSAGVNIKDGWAHATSQQTRDEQELVFQDLGSGDVYPGRRNDHFTVSPAPSSHISGSKTRRASQTSSRKGSVLSDFLTGKWLKVVTVDKTPKLHVYREGRSSAMKETEHFRTQGENGQLQEGLISDESTEPCQSRCHHQEVLPDRVATSNAVTNHEKTAPLPSRPWSTPKDIVPLSQATDANIAPGRTAKTSREPFVESDTSSMKSSTSPAREQTPEAHEIPSRYSPKILQFSQRTVSGDSPRTSAQADDDATFKKTGIKRVQMIVTFGGPDDLIIEAKLQRKRQHEER